MSTIFGRSTQEVTVTAEKHVISVYVELIQGASNVQGDVQVILKGPEVGMADTVYNTTSTRRNMADTSPEVQSAVATLVNAVLAWEAEDAAKPPPPPPPPKNVVHEPPPPLETE